MYEKYVSLRRTRLDPLDDAEGEWVDIEDESDDEIAFKANTDPYEVVPNEQLDDTLLCDSPPRQQDECHAQQVQQGDNPDKHNWAYDDEYQTLDPPDQFDDTFYTTHDNWTEDAETEMKYVNDFDKQVDSEQLDQDQQYVTHIQDGYTVEHIESETYENDIKPVPRRRTQEVVTAYHDLNLTQAIESQPDWAPTPVKVVGPEPELHELYFHEDVIGGPQVVGPMLKHEPPSVTSTPRKKVKLLPEEDLYPLHSPKSQSRSTAKLTNMFAEDLPHSEQKPSSVADHTSVPNTYSMRFTVSDVATDYNLYAGNNRRANNNPNREIVGRG